MESLLQGYELEASQLLGNMMRYTQQGDRRGSSSSLYQDADAETLESDLSTILALISRIAILLDTLEVERSTELDAESIETHRLRLQELRTKYQSIKGLFLTTLRARRSEEAKRRPRRDSGEAVDDADSPGGDGNDAQQQNAQPSSSSSSSESNAPRQRQLHLDKQQPTETSLFPANRPMVAKASAAATAAALRRTRAQMEAELARISSVGGLLQADATSLGKTKDEHQLYSADVSEAKQRAKAYKERQAWDRRYMLAAFALLAMSAGYIIARRLLWTFLRVRLP